MKRHKVSDDKLQIQIKQEADNDLNERTTTSSKPKIEEVKQKTPVKGKKTSKRISKSQVFKLAKEEAKVAQDVQISQFLMPYDIKKSIDSDNSDNYALLEGIGFPNPSSFEKVLQCMKEISIASVKKIQNNIQRIKATEKKLKELERKASENLKKKSKPPIIRTNSPNSSKFDMSAYFLYESVSIIFSVLAQNAYLWLMYGLRISHTFLELAQKSRFKT